MRENLVALLLTKNMTRSTYSFDQIVNVKPIICKLPHPHTILRWHKNNDDEFLSLQEQVQTLKYIHYYTQRSVNQTANLVNSIIQYVLQIPSICLHVQIVFRFPLNEKGGLIDMELMMYMNIDRYFTLCIFQGMDRTCVQNILRVSSRLLF